MAEPLPRITKIICPSCEGSGNCDLFSGLLGFIRCQWCDGKRRISVEEAISYADNLYTIGIGGYVCGDHDIEDADRMKAKAEAVCALAQQIPPWRSAA